MGGWSPDEIVERSCVKMLRRKDAKTQRKANGRRGKRFFKRTMDRKTNKGGTSVFHWSHPKNILLS
ncbi:hypothetical protein CVU37_04985 [candidate division BRC1 bacterium HGW-BRC1-1]|jgi:hypothetical protein|nr:MAG: hypothetical protein CVU37_04985 [candidate division BRC1 bacterium HGW-BRC1-1]